MLNLPGETVLAIDAGMDVNQPGGMESTALHYAYQCQSVEAVELLLNHGASVNVQNGFGKMPGES